MLSKRIQHALEERTSKNLLRTLETRESPQGPEVVYDGNTYLNFCSNDYLGLANHPEVIQAFKKATDHYGVGSGASHLLSGHCQVHHALEEELGAFLGYPAVLLFSTGYMANLGVVHTFVKHGDLLVQDYHNHASLIDAGLLARGEMRRYRHNDLKHLQTILETAPHKNKFIATQGVFSMSGELSPLPDIVALARSQQAYLIVDDAHGIGCLGETGRGILEHYRLTYQDIPILVGTLGKAFGSFGAFAAGESAFIETLRQFARTYIYTTALPPAICAATRASLAILQKEKWRNTHLKSLIETFRKGAQQRGLPILPSITPIQSLTIGDEKKAQQISQQLLKNGLLIKAIRYPTVALGQACLRISLTAAHTTEHTALLLENLNGL